MQAWWQFLLSCVVFVVISLKTPPPPPAKLNNLCIGSGRARVGVGGGEPGPAGHQMEAVGAGAAPAPSDYSDWNDGADEFVSGGLPAVVAHLLAAALCCTMGSLIYYMR